MLLMQACGVWRRTSPLVLVITLMVCGASTGVLAAALLVWGLAGRCAALANCMGAQAWCLANHDVMAGVGSNAAAGVSCSWAPGAGWVPAPEQVCWVWGVLYQAAAVGCLGAYRCLIWRIWCVLHSPPGNALRLRDLACAAGQGTKRELCRVPCVLPPAASISCCALSWVWRQGPQCRSPARQPVSSMSLGAATLSPATSDL